MDFSYATTLNQLEMNKIWELVPRPSSIFIIGIVFRNKIDTNWNIVGNKARLIAQG